MSEQPGVVYTTPRGPITRPEVGIPVLATLHSTVGQERDVPATATAWTRDAVEVAWVAEGVGFTRGWVPASDVRRGKAAEERLKQWEVLP
jgi:hypothetical protein